MRHGTSNRRSRGRNNNRGKGGGNNRAQVFDSNGPEVRIRGTAHQILEKYEALAKDARATGDHVLAESYLQHAEHYQRIILMWDEQAAQNNAQNEDGEETYNAKSAKKADNDDLSLPASILGGAVKTSSQAARELEDA
ncbi:MAG: DUF4167 domain-containing protein [Alphaproteobacteria bacterium]|nr:DUF4167 domain-containing protein [Alphaproteobacteria bacterium]